MKKKIVNEIFIDEFRRKKKILCYTIAVVILVLLGTSCLYFFIKNKNTDYINYNENSNVEYKVYLKDNMFFDKEYIGEKKQYIASLIKEIEAKFNYNMNIEKDDVSFKYTYGIKAFVDIIDKSTGKSLYSFDEVLEKDKIKTVFGENEQNITSTVNIDYNHYNEIARRFIGLYNLDNVEAKLSVKMFVETVGTCDDFKNVENLNSVVSLDIPLSEKTMEIEIVNENNDNEYKILMCKDNNGILNVCLIGLALCFYVGAIGALVFGIEYSNKTRTQKDIYEKELKRLLSDYHLFIQKVNNYFDTTGYQLVAVDNFDDMLEIRDTLSQPILMVDSKDNNGVHFLIPSNTNILYTYTLKMNKDLNSELYEKEKKRRTRKKKND